VAVYGVFGSVRGYFGCVLCQKLLKLSLKVDECQPLLPGIVAFVLAFYTSKDDKTAGRRVWAVAGPAPSPPFQLNLTLEHL
jgi:hypothetical protein